MKHPESFLSKKTKYFEMPKGGGYYPNYPLVEYSDAVSVAEDFAKEIISLYRERRKYKNPLTSYDVDQVTEIDNKIKEIELSLGFKEII